jgi:type VI secretion system protein ImpH
MASTSGPTANSLIEELAEEPYRFDFFRALRLLQAKCPDVPRIGYAASPAQEPVRFAQNPSLAFAPSTIESVRHRPTQPKPEVSVHFFGLFGPNGPLPLHLTEYARERQLHAGDHTFTAFANVFNHRLLSFFFRAWADNQKALDLDRPADQRFAAYIGSFFGLGMQELQNRDALADHAKLYFSGRLASQARNAEGLGAIIEDYFGVRTEVQAFHGRWMALPAENQCRLGESTRTGSVGQTTIVGSRFWDCQLSFRIRMGPMRLNDFARLLPDGQAFQRLQCWVRNYTGDELFWDVQLVLLRDEIPSTQLGKAGRLGWTTWLKTQASKQDSEDLVLRPPDF